MDARGGRSALYTARKFLSAGTCSETLIAALNEAYGEPLPDEERAAQPFAGGIMQHGFQCGAVWGAALAAGAQAHRVHGPGGGAEAHALRAASRVVAAFVERNGSVDCLDLTDIDKTTSVAKMIAFFVVKGGTVRCIHMNAVYAPRAVAEIDASLAEPLEPPPPGPVSCAAVLARRMGATEQQVAMAAGLGGGIGLCGGACGALGAAVWLTGIRILQERDDVKNLWGDDEFEARFVALVQRFLAATEHGFECHEVVGRRFEDAVDHAAWVREGGCAAVLDALAAQDVAGTESAA